MHIVVDDAKLNVRTAGAGEAVVLLHGFPFSSQVWNSQIETLSKTHFVIAPDLRGSGKSSVSAGPYLMETLAGDLAAILEALGVAHAAIVGHSLGGYVALAFFRMFSERVTRLALVCTRMDEDTAEVAKTRINIADSAEASDSMRPIIDFYNGKLLARGTSAAMHAGALQMMEATNPAGAAAMLRGIAARVSSEDLVEELQIPVLIITGAVDTLSPAAIWEGVIPGATLAVCPVSAHMPMLEEPDRLSVSLENFLQSRAGKS